MSGTYTSAFWHDERHGPLVVLLLVATLVTGLVDAVSYLKLGRVFVANMTGNVVFLGFAVADAKDFSVAASLAAIVAFLAGAFAGGRLGVSIGHHRARLVAIETLIKIILVGVALALTAIASDSNNVMVMYALIVLLALAMGLQNAVARRLAVPDLTTTVLTLTLTGLAADSTPAGGKNPNPLRRLIATATMFFGAALGAVLISKLGLSAVLMVVLGLLVFNVVIAYRYTSSSAAWTLAP